MMLSITPSRLASTSASNSENPPNPAIGRMRGREESEQPDCVCGWRRDGGDDDLYATRD